MSVKHPLAGAPPAHLTSMAGLCRTSPSQFQELLEAGQAQGALSLQICPSFCFSTSLKSFSSPSTCFDVNWNFLTR